MAYNIDWTNERIEAGTKSQKIFSYDDQTSLTYLVNGSLIFKSATSTLEFLTSDIVKYRVMKLFKYAIGPILQNIHVHFTYDKVFSETLEEYALRKGMTPKSFADQFNDEEQLNLIRQNIDYENLDLTLKFKFISVFKQFNEDLFRDERERKYFDSIINSLKTIRNDVCHNRENFTGYRYNDLNLKMKFYLGELLKIIQNWDPNFEISKERKKTGITFNNIMHGIMTNEDFRYMCLLKVIDLVAEPTLETVSTLICNKRNDESYKDYFSRNGIKGREYKDRFFPKEKSLLESKFEDRKPDITLYVKIIDICKDWLPALKGNPEAKEELKNIVSTVRGIRNRILHNVLSMTLKECIMEAHELVKCLNNLGKFALNKNLYMDLDIPKIDINKIDDYTHFIMHLPYPYS